MDSITLTYAGPTTVGPFDILTRRVLKSNNYAYDEAAAVDAGFTDITAVAVEYTIAPQDPTTAIATTKAIIAWWSATGTATDSGIFTDAAAKLVDTLILINDFSSITFTIAVSLADFAS